MREVGAASRKADKLLLLLLLLLEEEEEEGPSDSSRVRFREEGWVVVR